MFAQGLPIQAKEYNNKVVESKINTFWLRERERERAPNCSGMYGGRAEFLCAKTHDIIDAPLAELSRSFAPRALNP